MDKDELAISVCYKYGERVTASLAAGQRNDYSLQVCEAEGSDFRDFVICDGESSVSSFSSQGQDGNIAVVLVYTEVDAGQQAVQFRGTPEKVTGQVEAQLSEWM